MAVRNGVGLNTQLTRLVAIGDVYSLSCSLLLDTEMEPGVHARGLG